MAKILETDKGLKVIECSSAEIGKVNGLGFGVCDFCNDAPLPSQGGYYIAVLNSWYCPKCYEDWYKRAKYYPEDADIENRNFEFYRDLLDSKGLIE